MARQVTLTSVKVRHIMINEILEHDEEGNITGLAGYSCTIGYRINDENGGIVMNPESQKYTSGTSFADSEKLSGDSNKIVMDFVSAMTTNMNAKEEL